VRFGIYSNVDRRKGYSEQLEVICSHERKFCRIDCRLIELVETVRRVGVTTSGVANPSGPPSTVNCRRCGVELISGRCAVDVLLLRMCCVNLLLFAAFLSF